MHTGRGRAISGTCVVVIIVGNGDTSVVPHCCLPSLRRRFRNVAMAMLLWCKLVCVGQVLFQPLSLALGNGSLEAVLASGYGVQNGMSGGQLWRTRLDFFLEYLACGFEAVVSGVLGEDHQVCEGSKIRFLSEESVWFGYRRAWERWCL